MCQVEAPRDQRDERLARRVRQCRAVPIADVGDADAAGVESERLGADHVARDPAVAALPDVAVAIDEVVVANVVPAVRLHVVGVDRADDRRDVRLAVVVRGRRVVHEDHAHGWRVQRWRAAEALVRAPVGARQDRRLRVQARGAARQSGLRSAAPVHEDRAQRVHGSRCAQLDDAARTGPHRLGDRDAGSRMYVLSCGQQLPASEAAAVGAGAKLDAAAALPARTHEIEPERRTHGCRRRRRADWRGARLPPRPRRGHTAGAPR